MLPENDTIVAVSTPPGRGAIGIVRLSGASARTIAEPLCRLRHPLAAGRARFAEILDGASGDVLDEAVVTYFAAPHSYTSEDVVEIAVHGAPVLLEYLVRACIAGGARLAEAGEFTQRAFLSGRLDLTQAEAVNDLIAAQTLAQARLAAAQLGGSLARAVGPAKEKLVGLIAALEAGVDFAEDDIDLMADAEVVARIAEVEVPLQALKATYGYGRVMREGLRLAIVGRPNAGKSSLFNALLGRDRAIVTAQPGTTRDAISEKLALGGVPVELIDTAGLRDQPEGEAEAQGILRSRETLAEADFVLLVVDAAAGEQVEDRATRAGLVGRPHRVVMSKCDLVRGQDDATPPQTVRLSEVGHPEVWVSAKMGGSAIPPQTVRLSEMGHPESWVSAKAGGSAIPPQTVGLSEMGHPESWVSAKTGEGLEELKAAILASLTAIPSGDSALLTNLRQHEAITEALRALGRARAAVGLPHEFLLLDLHAALEALDGLTGTTTAEDILRVIFSSFCIGK